MIEMDEIEKNLYLSGLCSAENIRLLKEKQIKYVLSVFNDNLIHKSEDITYLKIEAEDHHNEDLLTHFPETNEFIAKAQEANEGVLVHCHAGVSRSTTIVLAFLMNKYRMTYESAEEMVRECRPRIRPNRGFVDQLRLYQEMGFTLNVNNEKFVTFSEEKSKNFKILMRNMDEVEPHLYLSGSYSAENIRLLKEKKIKYVLSVFNKGLCDMAQDITYKKIEKDDHPFEDLLTHFPESNELISKAQASNQNVLVHCNAGISRSPTIVLAFIMNKYKMSYDSALEVVKKCRAINPNLGFVGQLKLYEEMGFTLNANNKKLRQHLMTKFFNFSRIWSMSNENTIDKYFKRQFFIENMTQDLDLGKRCVCAKCGHYLFNEIHILPTNESTEWEPINMCVWTYIEPQRWMTALTQAFNKMTEFDINCPGCGQPLIELQQIFAQYLCECCLHSDQPYLRFRIANNKFKTE